MKTAHGEKAFLLGTPQEHCGPNSPLMPVAGRVR